MPPSSNNLLAGRYRLLDVLGEGGMGRVWKARDELLNRDVAVKEITPAGMSATELGDVRERAFREAQAIAQVTHPCVVRVFDCVDNAGTPAIVMELVRSSSLYDVLRREGPMAPRRAARIGLDILAGLRAAHAMGILHRDVKPANVLLGDDGRVVLTDFGLATMAGDSALTRTGIVLGSPSYLAPERALDEPADAKADLWSLGATLFAAVEGRPPYDKSSPMATLAALMVEPPPVSARAGVLEPVLAALLQKDPAQRATSDEALMLLRAAAAGEAPPSAAIRTTATDTAAVRAAATTAAAAQSAATTTVGEAGRSAAPSRRRWAIAAAVAVVVAGLVAWPLLGDRPAGTADASVAAPSPAAPPVAVAVESRQAAPDVLPSSRTPSSKKPSRSAKPSRSPSLSPSTKAADAPGTTPATSDAPPVATGTAVRSQGTGTCLDRDSGSGAIQLWQCEGTDNQRFSFPGDGTMRVLGRCVQLTGTSSGSRLTTATCSGSPAQRFTLNAAADLVSIQVDMCVDVPDADPGNGVPAQIWECAGTTNQKWYQ
ncbi:protein kinase [Actinoplanes sp. NPDC051494]|uniref:protein kinase domain-containing protein n=1 Tax=Actinoplanes sp. NPDC051494 TaxID=3363907 RepID=UPI00379840B3